MPPDAHVGSTDAKPEAAASIDADRSARLDHVTQPPSVRARGGQRMWRRPYVHGGFAVYRPRCAAALRTALAGTALCAAACITSFGQQAESVRAGLIGMPARDLRSCIGIPRDVQTNGDVEVLVFRWEEVPRDLRGDADVEYDSPVFDPSECVDARDPDRAREPRLPRRDGEAPKPIYCRRSEGGIRPASRQTVAYCQLVFEVRDGAVASVSSEGRAASGLNENAKCLLRARSCVSADR